MTRQDKIIHTRKLNLILCSILLLLIGVACKNSTNNNNLFEKNKIKALLLQERTAHFEKNAALFVSGFADTILSVNKGMVKMASKKEMKIKMQRYFDAVEFIKWDDIAEPIIKFSNDASLAYVTLQKEVIVKDKSVLQPARKDTTIYAWISIYQKLGNDWKLVSNISTNK